MNSINSEVYVDISIIIKMMPIEMREKISKSFINFIERNKSNSYISNINPNIPIGKQNIRKETKEMLGIIYRDFLCSNEERNRLLKQEEYEIKQYEEELRQKYNLNYLFKGHNELMQDEFQEINDNVSLVHYKENNFKRFLNKIKNIFMKIK